MIATSTTFLNSLLNSEIEQKTSKISLNKDEALFYTLLKPSLNVLVKQPTQESVNKILNFSKSI